MRRELTYIRTMMAPKLGEQYVFPGVRHDNECPLPGHAARTPSLAAWLALCACTDMARVLVFSVPLEPDIACCLGHPARGSAGSVLRRPRVFAEAVPCGVLRATCTDAAVSHIRFHVCRSLALYMCLPSHHRPLSRHTAPLHSYVCRNRAPRPSLSARS